MKIIMKMIVLLLIFNGSLIQAEDNQGWYEKTKSFTQETIHDIKTDDVTFESFYKESSSIGWIIAGVVAIISAVAIFYSGGTATPVVSAIGTWIGNMMGFSGIVATNAGLALLGGGSIASGGFGIIGGTALLTGALTFGTEVIVDYTIGPRIDKYSYTKFTENSKNMMTLPLPKNTDGCDSYEEAIDILEDIDTEKPLSSSDAQILIKKAIKVLEEIDDGDIDADEEAKKESLYALLYFVSNEYQKSKKHANKSIELANKARVKHTISSYISATSSLYDETFDYDKLADYLKYSFSEEPDNPLIPLFLSIHMDRMMYRYGDGIINEKSFNKVFSIVSDESLKEFQLKNYIIVLSRYFITIKLEQQKISSIAITDNKTIKNSIKSLESIKQSYQNYKDLIKGADKITSKLELIKVEEENQIETKKQVDNFKKLIGEYNDDKTRLQGLIKKLENYQASLSKDEVVKTLPTKSIQIEKKSDSNNFYILIALGILLLILIGYFLTRKKEE